jgi:hypothetical protein
MTISNPTEAQKNWFFRKNPAMPKSNNLVVILVASGALASITIIAIAVGFNYQTLADHANGLNGHEEIYGTYITAGRHAREVTGFHCGLYEDDFLARVGVGLGSIFGGAGLLASGGALIVCAISSSGRRKKLRAEKQISDRQKELNNETTTDL